jgi:arylesterase/paraoxonase
VLLDEERYYVTNDHGYEHGIGRLVEEYGNLAISNVLYCDGVEHHIAADGISFANGINYDVERNLLFVASPRRFCVKAFVPQEDGSLEFVEDIPCGTGVDNIEFDDEGNLWIGCHPDLLHFASYAKQKKDISPSEIIKIEYRAKGDYTVTSIYENDGSQLSATSVAAPFNDLIFAGTVKDDKMLILKLSEN